MEKAKEINILALCKSLLRKAWLIVLCAIVFGIGGYVYTDQCVAPMYRSSILLYVNNSARTDNNDNISSSDLATSQRLVKTYIIILRSDPVMEKVAANLERSTGRKLGGGSGADLRNNRRKSRKRGKEVSGAYLCYRRNYQIANALSEESAFSLKMW